MNDLSGERPPLSRLRDSEQLTIDGGQVRHHDVVAAKERLEREARSKEIERRRQEAIAQREHERPMDPEIMTPLFDE